nr:MAG TPA: hypothetical protein [Caudoviricetes sp.]
MTRPTLYDTIFIYARTAEFKFGKGLRNLK